MDYEKEIAAILDASRTLDADTHRLSWHLARTTPDAIGRTAYGRVDQMKSQSEPFARMGRTEHARVQAEIEKEEAAARELAAGPARWHVEKVVPVLDRRYRELVTRRQGDVGLSFPHALDRVDANGMLTYHLLTEALRPSIENADPAELLRRYTRALESRDARSRIEAELIEARVGRGGLADDLAEVPAVKELGELIAEVQAVRVPDELAGVPKIIAEAQRAVTLADVAHIIPADPTHPAHLDARHAYEAAADEFVVEQQLAKAAGR